MRSFYTDNLSPTIDTYAKMNQTTEKVKEEKPMKKTYGSTSTQLILTKKAKALYNSTDPLTIEEIETEDGLHYNITGAFEAQDLTAEQVNSTLEDIADEMTETAIRDLARNWIENDRTGDYSRKITLDEAADLIRNMDDDERPEGTTAEEFMEVWNDLLQEGTYEDN